MKRHVEVYEAALKAEDASAITAIAQISALRALAKHDPNRVRAWLEALLGATDKRTLRDGRALGLGLASAFSSYDPPLRASCLGNIPQERRPPINAKDSVRC